jgi:hypothetical protein
MKVMAGGFRRPQPGNLVQEKLKRDGAMLAALKWVLRNPNVHTTIPSMTDMDQLDENLKACAQPFGAADEKVLALRPVRPGARAIPATGRGAHRGALHGVPRLHRAMPLRRARGPTPDPRAGPLRLLRS